MNGDQDLFPETVDTGQTIRILWIQDQIAQMRIAQDDVMFDAIFKDAMLGRDMFLRQLAILVQTRKGRNRLTMVRNPLDQQTR